MLLLVLRAAYLINKLRPNVKYKMMNEYMSKGYVIQMLLLNISSLPSQLRKNLHHPLNFFGPRENYLLLRIV